MLDTLCNLNRYNSADAKQRHLFGVTYTVKKKN
jgi:hypothetical protein